MPRWCWKSRLEVWVVANKIHNASHRNCFWNFHEGSVSMPKIPQDFLLPPWYIDKSYTFGKFWKNFSGHFHSFYLLEPEAMLMMMSPVSVTVVASRTWFSRRLVFPRLKGKLLLLQPHRRSLVHCKNAFRSCMNMRQSWKRSPTKMICNQSCLTCCILLFLWVFDLSHHKPLWIIFHHQHISKTAMVIIHNCHVPKVAGKVAGPCEEVGRAWRNDQWEVQCWCCRWV